jgi:two-component system, cell cycle response regulator CtrA
MNIIAAGLDATTIAFLRAQNFNVDLQDIDGPEDLQDWLRDGMYGAGVIELERSLLGIFCARGLRSAGITAPVIGISSGSGGDRKWSDHRAMFLENGGDDLIKAPVNPRELAATILAVTRRDRGQLIDVVVERKIGDAAFRMNLSIGSAEINGMFLHLTGKERAVLTLLVTRAGRICSKETVLANLYGASADKEPEIKIVDVFICKVRHKLNELHPGIGEKLIETVWGQGYMFPRESASIPAVAA